MTNLKSFDVINNGSFITLQANTTEYSHEIDLVVTNTKHGIDIKEQYEVDQDDFESINEYDEYMNILTEIKNWNWFGSNEIEVVALELLHNQ